MGRRSVFIWALALVLGGCAGASHVRVGQEGDLGHEPTSLPYKLALAFQSDIPDPYYLTAGPTTSYGRYQLNGAFEAMLQEYVSLKSSAGASKTAELRVYLRGIRFTYDEIGLRNLLERYRSARAQDLPLPGDILFADGSARDGNGLLIPQEVVKGAEVDGEVEIVEGGRSIGQKAFSAELTNRLYWWDYNGYNYYDFRPLMRGVINTAILEIDRFVDQILGRP